MRILLENNELNNELSEIYEEVAKQCSIEIKKGKLSELHKLKTKEDLLLIYCDTTSDMTKYKRFKGVNILVVTKNTTVGFIYSLLQNINPIDVIGLNRNEQAISVRIKSNLEFLKGGKYEEDNMYNNDACYCQ